MEHKKEKKMSALKNILLFFASSKKEDKSTLLQGDASKKTLNTHSSDGCCGHCGGQE